MILASDGVWEFLSNDEVIDLIVPFWHRNDLKGACSTVVKESVAAWEREEDSIDDITCIIVFFKRSGPHHDYSQTARNTVESQQQHAAIRKDRAAPEIPHSTSNLKAVALTMGRVGSRRAIITTSTRDVTSKNPRNPLPAAKPLRNEASKMLTK